MPKSKADHIQPGSTLLNKYKLERLLGQGAFAEVYLATHLELRQPRALKILRRDAPGLGSTEYTDFTARFMLEAQLGAKLDHSNLVRVYDFERDNQTLILVIEYCPGGSLADRLEHARQEGQRIPLEECLKIALDIAQGLSAVHQLDAVHRDLKPSNILFDAQGRAKVADLGLAQVPGGPSQRSLLSQSTPHPGTPGYKSPEQESSGETLKPPSDIYVLGLILFEMLTGRIYGNLRPGTRLVSLRPDAPVWLDELLARMLSKNPEERPWDGKQAAELLEDGLKSLGLEQRQPLQKEEPPPQQKAEQPQLDSPQQKTEQPQLDSPPHKAQVPLKIPAAWKKYAPWLAGGVALVILIIIVISSIGPGKDSQLATQTAASATDTARAANLPTVEDKTAVPVITETHTPPPDVSITDTPEPPPTELPELIKDEAGVEMALIPGGSFMMGDNTGRALEVCRSHQTNCDPIWFSYSEPVHAVYVDALYMDVYEVTNAQYAVFLNAKGNQEQGGVPWLDAEGASVKIHPAGEKWQVDAGFAEHPVIDVSWYGAQAYCEWRGGRLPTEAEWEKAARGGLQGKHYPWGDEPPVCAPEAWNGAQYVLCEGDTIPVGSFQPNGYRLYDMAGNVWEWVADWFAADYYALSAPENPTGPATGSMRVLRGGGSTNIWVDTSTRISEKPEDHLKSVGFRCVRPIDTDQPTNSPTVLIPAGSFLMGEDADRAFEVCQIYRSDCDRSKLVYEEPIHRVYLDTFSIDVYEVSNAQFAAFLNAMGNQREGGSYWLDDSANSANIHQQSGSWQAKAGFDDHPVVEVSWYGAKAYCAWRGGRLPSEAEWERAARGNMEGNLYPWGDDIPVCTPGAPNGAQYGDCMPPGTLRVGSFGANHYGVFDMTGNVWEWVSDWFDKGYYSISPQVNPMGPDGGDSHVLRGGAWDSTPDLLRLAYRHRDVPYSTGSNYGFRCVYTP